MIEYGRALYYPTIRFQNLNWFKLSTLFYDGLDRIVPEGFYVGDRDEIKQINDEIGYVRDVNPKPYADAASEKFVEYLKNNILTLSEEKLNEVISRDDRHQYHIHYDKIGGKLISEIRNVTNIQEGIDWYEFSPILGFTYMTYLANEIGEKKELPVVTDDEKNQVVLNTIQVDSKIEEEDVSFNLASLAIKSYLPRNIEHVPVHKLISFRKNHQAERMKFYSAINGLVDDLNEATNKDTLEDILNYRKKEIDNSVNELRLSLTGLKIEVSEGLLGLSAPSLLKNIPVEAEYSSTITALGYITASIFLGAKSYYRKRKIRQDSPYSYLISLENSKLGQENLLKQFVRGKIII